MLQTINQKSNRMTKRLFAVVVLLCATTASLVAKDIVPQWYKSGKSHFKAVEKNTESNFTMSVMATIDGEQCDSAFEIGVFCGDECRLSMPLYSSDDLYEYFGYYSMLTIKGENGEKISFRLYDHRNNAEVTAAVRPDVIDFVSDKHYGSFNTELYNLTFASSTTHRMTLELDDAHDLPFTGRIYGTTADGIACSYTRNAYLDGGFESIVLPFDTDITEMKAAGFSFEKFQGFGENTIIFVELAEDENLQAGVPYIFRYTGTVSDGRQELQFTANVQQASGNIKATEGWSGTFKYMNGNAIAGKYILNIKGDKMQKAGSGAKLHPYRCYLELPEGTDASMLSVSHRENTTGITDVDCEVKSGDIFDLQGRKLDRIPCSGIIIKNNKKIYIK